MTARAAVHFAARRIAPRLLRRAGLLRFLPGGLAAFVLAEAVLFVWKRLHARAGRRRMIRHAAAAVYPLQQGRR